MNNYISPIIPVTVFLLAGISLLNVVSSLHATLPTSANQTAQVSASVTQEAPVSASSNGRLIAAPSHPTAPMQTASIVSNIETSSAGEAPATGPIASWNLDEGTGTLAGDGSGNNHSASLNSPYWISGKVGKAVSFDGAVQTMNVPELTLNASAVTESFWLNSSFTGGVISELTDDSNISENGFGIFSGDTSVCPAASIAVEIRGDAGYNIKCYSAPGRGWHHFAAVLDKQAASDGEIELFVDGMLQNPVSIPFAKDNTNLFTTNPLHMMSRGGNQRYFKGSLDEVRFYDRALTATEIRQLSISTPQ